MPANTARHITNVHEKVKPYKYPFCDLTMARSSNLAKHIKGVHDLKKDHMCAQCEYATSYTATICCRT